MAVRDDNGVPILALSNSSQEFVQGRHDAAIAALGEGDHSHLLTGAVVYVHNRKPVNSPDTPDVTRMTIGGSTLHEAVTEVVGAFEAHTHLEAPTFVASTDEDIARLVAEHYDCKVVSIEEAVAQSYKPEPVADQSAAFPPATEQPGGDDLSA